MQVPEADLVAAFKILSQDDENTGLVEVAVLKDVMAYVAQRSGAVGCWAGLLCYRSRLRCCAPYAASRLHAPLLYDAVSEQYARHDNKLSVRGSRRAASVGGAMHHALAPNRQGVRLLFAVASHTTNGNPHDDDDDDAHAAHAAVFVRPGPSASAWTALSWRTCCMTAPRR